MKSRHTSLAAIAFPALLVFSMTAFRAPAQELRTIIAGIAVLSSELSDGVRLTMAYNEAVAILIPKDSPFIQGFEIELKAPASALAQPGALAYELWRRIDPMPDKNRYVYTGDRFITQPLPGRAGMVLQVPTRRDHSLKSGPYSTLIPMIIESKDFPFIFKLESVSKGVSTELENAQFQIRIRPLLTDEGALRLFIRFPEGGDPGNIALFVDEKRLADGHYFDGKESLVLKAGSHYLRVSSDKYRDESRTISVEQGKTIDLAIDLQDTTPILIIEAPDSAQLFLDNLKLVREGKSAWTIDPGDHVLSCKIGDYTLMRKFTAFRGKTYKIVLSIDLQVQENP